MIFDLLEIPKVVDRDEYALNKLEYSVVNNIEKRNEEFLLFNKGIFLDKKHYYNIFDLSEKIKKDYSNSLYIILEKDNVNNFRLVIGNTIDINNASYYAKYKVLATDIIENKNKISDIIKISTTMLNIENIVVFHVGITKEDVQLILDQENSSFVYTFDKNIDKYFYYLIAKEKPFSKVSPFLLAAVAIFILSTISGMIADSISAKNIARQKLEIDKIQTQINGQNLVIQKLTGQNAELEKFSQKNLKIFLKEGQQ